MNPSQLQSPKYTFCVGMRRGGSTLQTQLVAALLGRVPMRLVTPESLPRFLEETRDEPGPIVVKCHRYLPEAVDLFERKEALIVYTFRDIRDVVASVSKKYNIPQFAFVHGGLQRLLDEYHQWTQVPGIYIARYETMIEDIAEEAIRLGKFLNVTVTPEEAQALAEEFSVASAKQKIEASLKSDQVIGVGQNHYDARALLHTNHIQTGGAGGFRDILTSDVIAALESQCRDWLLTHHYPLESTRWQQFASQSRFNCKALLHKLKRCILRQPATLTAGKELDSLHADAD